MKSFLRIPLSLAAAAMFGLGCGASDEDTQPQVELGDEEMISAEINNLKGDVALQWWKVRKELGKYKDVNLALADGYIPVSGCDAIPGVGAMGFHYLNLEAASDLVNDPFKPEILLYAPDDDGGLVLTGVEYFQAEVGQPRPNIMGQGFDGPMPGHNPQMPVHYDLHVWLYRFNNTGLFAAWNPRVKCPAP
jgi:hypothetical protein